MVKELAGDIVVVPGLGSSTGRFRPAVGRGSGLCVHEEVEVVVYVITVAARCATVQFNRVNVRHGGTHSVWSPRGATVILVGIRTSDSVHGQIITVEVDGDLMPLICIVSYSIIDDPPSYSIVVDELDITCVKQA